MLPWYAYFSRFCKDTRPIFCLLFRFSFSSMPIFFYNAFLILWFNDISWRMHEIEKYSHHWQVTTTYARCLLSCIPRMCRRGSQKYMWLVKRVSWEVGVICYFFSTFCMKVRDNIWNGVLTTCVMWVMRREFSLWKLCWIWKQGNRRWRSRKRGKMNTRWNFFDISWDITR